MDQGTTVADNSKMETVILVNKESVANPMEWKPLFIQLFKETVMGFVIMSIFLSLGILLPSALHVGINTATIALVLSILDCCIICQVAIFIWKKMSCRNTEQPTVCQHCMKCVDAERVE